MNPPAAVQVICPACRKGVLLASAAAELQVRCPVCAASYRVEEGVVDLLPPGPEAPAALFQTFIQSTPLISLYESIFWRRSWLFEALALISFEREYSLIAADAELASSRYCLDLACGTGIYLRRFARESCDGLVCGLDVSMGVLREAARRSREEGVSNVLLIHGDAVALPFPEEQFDVVNCGSALHLLAEPSVAIAEVHRVLKSDGRFTLAVLRREEGALMDYCSGINKVLFGVGSFSLSGLTGMLEEAGFSAVRCLHAGGVWLVLSARKPGC
jgi:SAM-dependent methyltransferase